MASVCEAHFNDVLKRFKAIHCDNSINIIKQTQMTDGQPIHMLLLCLFLQPIFSATNSMTLKRCHTEPKMCNEISICRMGAQAISWIILVANSKSSYCRSLSNNALKIKIFNNLCQFDAKWTSLRITSHFCEFRSLYQIALALLAKVSTLSWLV